MPSFTQIRLLEDDRWRWIRPCVFGIDNGGKHTSAIVNKGYATIDDAFARISAGPRFRPSPTDQSVRGAS